MYLRGSKWSMNRRRKRTNWFNIVILSLLVLGGAYVNRYVVPNVQPIGVPTSTPTRPPESYITEAQQYFDNGKLLQAIDAYQQAIAAQPDDAATYVALAQVQVWAGQYADAQKSAENALLLNTNNSMAHAVRAWALDFQGNYLEAEAAVKQAIDLDANNGIAHAHYAEILIDSGSFDNIQKAIDQANMALALAPNSIEAHRARGYVLENTANYEDAIKQYNQAIQINSKIADLHMALGRNYKALGVYDQAIAEFQQADALNPADPNPLLYISRTYATVGEYAKAVQYAESAVKNGPTDPYLRGNLGVMYYRNVQWPDALQQLSLVVNGGTSSDGYAIKALPLTSTDSRVSEYYFTYGLALARLNRCGEALQIAQLIVDRVPSDEIAVANANDVVNTCRNNLNATPTPLLSTPGAETVPSETPTPQAETPTPQATP